MQLLKLHAIYKCIPTAYRTTVSWQGQSNVFISNDIVSLISTARFVDPFQFWQDAKVNRGK